MKIRTALALASATLLPTLIGCESAERRDTPWVWTEPARTGWQPEPAPMPHADIRQAPSPYAARPVDTHDASIAVFSGTGTGASAGATRRDDIMGVRTAEVLPDRLGWPTDDRPSLNHTRTIRSSTSPDRWVYPSTRRDGRRNARRYYGGGR